MSDLEQNKVVTPRVKTEAVQADGPLSTTTADEAPDAPNGAPVSPARRLWTFIQNERKGVVLSGNQLRPLRGGLTALAGGVVAFLLMSAEAQFRWGVPVGILAMVVATVGVLDFLGTFDDPEERVANRVTMTELRRPLL